MLLTLREKRNEAGNAWSFVFEPPEPLTWEAGQYLRYELPHDNPDERGIERWFTIASAPYEGMVQITTRIVRSSFKKALAAMNPGDKITADGLEGDFTWPDDAQKTVFVAAGIGITPYHSMLKQRVNDGASAPVTLIYGNRTKEIVFKEELDRWSVAHPELQVFYKIGVRLTAENLSEIVSRLPEHVVYLSGPEEMVEDLGDQLVRAGMQKKHIKQDSFPGYNESSY
jgi:ferredoxin-NADP reductase